MGVKPAVHDAFGEHLVCGGLSFYPHALFGRIIHKAETRPPLSPFAPSSPGARGVDSAVFYLLIGWQDGLWIVL